MIGPIFPKLWLAKLQSIKVMCVSFLKQFKPYSTHCKYCFMKKHSFSRAQKTSKSGTISLPPPPFHKGYVYRFSLSYYLTCRRSLSHKVQTGCVVMLHEKTSRAHNFAWSNIFKIHVLLRYIGNCLMHTYITSLSLTCSVCHLLSHDYLQVLSHGSKYCFKRLSELGKKCLLTIDIVVVSN